MNPEQDPKPESEPEAPLKRLEAAIEHDVEEARAIAPLVADADSVQQRVRSKLSRALPLLVLAGLGVALLLSGVHNKLNLDNLAQQHQAISVWAAQHPWLSALGLMTSIALIISTGLPGGVVLVVAGGVILGALKGALLAATGDTLGALVLYFAARRFFMGGGAQPPALVRRIRAGFEQAPASFAFFIRMVPVFPYGATSVALAWLGCPLRLFVLASWVGVLPSSFIYAAIGAGFADTLARQQPISLDIVLQPRFLLPLLGLAALALLPALFGLKRKAAEPPGNKS
jgi:uncharacterized membrane protein YdjX (TVP38/TMEM64 family)